MYIIIVLFTFYKKTFNKKTFLLKFLSNLVVIKNRKISFFCQEGREKMEFAKKRKKSTRSRKRTKAQEEKRSKLLSRILDKWVYIKYNDGVEDNYMFLKHCLQNEKSHTKIEQIVLSGDPLQDGVYLITDYDVDAVYDKKINKELIELRPIKFDLKVGMYAEEQITESYDDLKGHLIGAKYLTEEEFYVYCQSTKKPPGIEQMILSYDSYSKERE